MAKVSLIKGAVASPAVVLTNAHHELGVEENGYGEVAVILQGDNGTECMWSSMPFSSLVYAHRMLGIEIDRIMTSD